METQRTHRAKLAALRQSTNAVITAEAETNTSPKPALDYRRGSGEKNKPNHAAFNKIPALFRKLFDKSLKENHLLIPFN